VQQQIKLGEELRNKEHFKTFEEYAGETYLGILRMDVDGLGARFIRGFKDLEEYTAFSQRMAIFFDKNVRTIQQKDYYRDDLNIIYAGGDDLFVVGRWDKIIEFAAEVRQQFMQHMQGEGVTISGGIAIVHPKFPIAKAAILSGEAEEKAKTYNNSQKNAICFFNQCVSWDKEYDEVLQMKNEMLYQIDTNGVCKGLLQQMMLYAQMAERGDLKYLWHATYYMTRMIKEKQNSPAKEYLQNLRDKQITRGVTHMRLIALAARWAEQELRINKH
jgi:CRISPR-associated protein Csm1